MVSHNLIQRIDQRAIDSSCYYQDNQLEANSARSSIAVSGHDMRTKMPIRSREMQGYELGLLRPREESKFGGMIHQPPEPWKSMILFSCHIRRARLSSISLPLCSLQKRAPPSVYEATPPLANSTSPSSVNLQTFFIRSTITTPNNCIHTHHHHHHQHIGPSESKRFFLYDVLTPSLIE